MTHPLGTWLGDKGRLIIHPYCVQICSQTLVKGEYRYEKKVFTPQELKELPSSQLEHIYLQAQSVMALLEMEIATREPIVYSDTTPSISGAVVEKKS